MLMANSPNEKGYRQAWIPMQSGENIGVRGGQVVANPLN